MLEDLELGSRVRKHAGTFTDVPWPPSREQYPIYTPGNGLRSMEGSPKGRRASLTGGPLSSQLTLMPSHHLQKQMWSLEAEEVPHHHRMLSTCKGLFPPTSVACLFLPIDLCWCGWARCQTSSLLCPPLLTPPPAWPAPRGVWLSILF